MSYEYLAHHGILGQKWGVRRYQNSDGSYTPRGRDRHADADRKRVQKYEAKGKEDAKKGNKWATSSHQPSSKKASVLAGAYAATGSKRLGNKLDLLNKYDNIRYESAKKEYSKIPKGKKVNSLKITKEKNSYYNKTYKELYDEYAKNDISTAADRAHAKAKRMNTQHLIDVYGKERMDKYYSDENKKAKAAAAALISSLAIMGTTSVIANKVL